MIKQLPVYLLFLAHPLIAQNDRAQQQTEFATTVSRAQGPLTIDGILSEADWQGGAPADSFWMKWPRDGGPAPEQTEVRCLFDDQHLYIGAICYDTTPHNVVQSLKRDVGYWDSDGFAVVLDPANTGNNGYFFCVNVAGAQSEALIATGAEDEDFNWDNVWRVETHTYADRWTVEMAIPLRILRFKAGQTTWGINFVRNDLGNGIYSTWARVPFQFQAWDLGYTGALQWQETPVRNKGNYNLIPYASAAVSRDYEEGEDWKFHPQAGLDAKVGVGTGMNLDITLNPDFSQVEIDQQVVNLTRFDVQLPEKRTFFLENGDLFGNFGIPPLRPFFSRRIGLDDDGEPLPILGGLRLSGNLNPDSRLGIMTMQTGKKDSIPSRNNTALVFKQNVHGRSTVAGYFLNRQDFGQENGRDQTGYSRNAGVELSYISKNGQWMSWATHHRVWKPETPDGNSWWGNAGIFYNSRRFSILTDVTHVGENYYADLGFEPRIENYDEVLDSTLRIAYNYIFNEVNYKIFPHNRFSRLNFCELRAPILFVLNDDGSINEFNPLVDFTMNFKNTSELVLGLRPVYTRVPVHFKLDDEEDLALCPALPPDDYRFMGYAFEWNSDYRQNFQWGVGGVAGSYYNGEQYTLTGKINYRIRQFANLNLQLEYNRLPFPKPYCTVEYVNITPRLEVFFAKNLWWTTFVQYNTQADNFNVNSRLQWRYRPMSDVFLVYTDNYAVEARGPKNKALVLKVNYWW